jgi:hypothetical protein
MQHPLLTAAVPDGVLPLGGTLHHQPDRASGIDWVHFPLLTNLPGFRWQIALALTHGAFLLPGWPPRARPLPPGGLPPTKGLPLTDTGWMDRRTQPALVLSGETAHDYASTAQQSLTLPLLRYRTFATSLRNGPSTEQTTTLARCPPPDQHIRSLAPAYARQLFQWTWIIVTSLEASHSQSLPATMACQIRRIT